jgi:hypothetical protein
LVAAHRSASGGDSVQSTGLCAVATRQGRQTRTMDSGRIQYSNWGISPQLVGLKYKMWSTKRGTYPKGDQAQKGIRDGVNECPKDQ